MEAAAAGAAEDSLRRRYFFKLLANAAAMFVSLFTQLIVPRSLGPQGYGVFGFLSSHFLYVVGFLDAGTSTGFYTKLSQRPHDAGLRRFYWGYTLALALIVVLYAALGFAWGVQDWLWPDHIAPRFVWLALGLALVTQAQRVIGHIVDAYGLTAAGEIARLVQMLVGLAVILALFFAGRLRLTEYFLYQWLMLALLGAA